MNANSQTRNIAVIAFVGGLGGGLVFPILPALGLALGIPAFMIGLILSANRISRVIFNVPAGRMMHRLGARTILTGALLVETVGVLGFSAALHFGNATWWLLGGRILYGIGTAFLLVGAQTAVLNLSNREDRGRKTASVRVAMGAAMPCGLVLGGILADLASDDASFLVGACITFAGAIFSALALPKTSNTTQPNTSTTHKISLASALQPSPNQRLVLAAWGFNFLIFLTTQGVLLSTMVVLVKQRNIHLLGLKAQGTSGLVMAVLVSFSATMAIVIGRALDKMPLRSILVAPALMGLAGGFVLLAFANSTALTLLGSALVGVSYNAVTLPLMALMGDAISRDQYGAAVGIYQVCGDIGGTIGPILGLVVGIHVGLLTLYLCLAALILVAIPIALWLKKHERQLVVSS